MGWITRRKTGYEEPAFVALAKQYEAQLAAEFPVGLVIEYLGASVSVVAAYPKGVRGRYADSNGRIHEIEMSVQEARVAAGMGEGEISDSEGRRAHEAGLSMALALCPF